MMPCSQETSRAVALLTNAHRSRSTIAASRLRRSFKIVQSDELDYKASIRVQVSVRGMGAIHSSQRLNVLYHVEGAEGSEWGGRTI